MLSLPSGRAVICRDLHHHVAVSATTEDLSADRRRCATPVVLPRNAKLNGFVLDRLAASAGTACDLGDVAYGIEGAYQLDLGLGPARF